jgi:hypothetical protein
MTGVNNLISILNVGEKMRQAEAETIIKIPEIKAVISLTNILVLSDMTTPPT